MAEGWFTSWSGGKDSALALHRALKAGLSVKHLLTMQNSSGRQSRSHGLPPELLQDQAASLGMQLWTGHASWSRYEAVYRRALDKLAAEGVAGGVFGDIDIEAHGQWVRQRCKEAVLKCELPLWQARRVDLLREFIDAGFKAIICTVRLDRLDASWLGRLLDEDFLADLSKRNDVDLCGENGEYHTFVYDGPVFKHVVPYSIERRNQRQGYGFLTLSRK